VADTIRGGLDEVGEFTCPDNTNKRFIIYGLFDPRDGELRYIGKSCSGMKRPKNHTKNSDLRRHGKTHKTAWIKSMLKLGLKPTFGVLFEGDSADDLYGHEQRLIKYFKDSGARLTNATDGGPGRTGYRLSAETKEKISRAAKKQQRDSPTKHSSETKEMLKNLQLGRKHGLGHRANMSKAHGGKPFIEESSGKRFETQSQAAEFFGLHQTKIGLVLRGKRKTTGGRRFSYVES